MGHNRFCFALFFLSVFKWKTLQHAFFDSANKKNVAMQRTKAKLQVWSPLFSSVQSLSHVRLFATPWITARQASLSITNSQSLLKLMAIKLVMPSSHLILCHPFSSCPQPLPSSGSFPMSQLFAWGGQSTGVSASASVLPMNTQDWSPLLDK